MLPRFFLVSALLGAVCLTSATCPDAAQPGNVRRRAVVAIAEPEYDTKTTLPPLAKKVLADQLGLAVTVLQGDNKTMEIPGFAEAVAGADLVILSIRRLAPLEKDLAALKKYLDAGKPLMGIRTACHAFDAKGTFPPGHAEWVKFDPEVLGGNYHNHHTPGIACTIAAASGAQAKAHAIMTGIQVPFKSEGSLYKTGPLSPSATPLLIGTIPNQQPEPVAWVHQYKNAKVFFTSLGHASDFDNPQFVQLLHNAAQWCLEMKVGKD